ncbi:hypothetical protein DL765_009948 [Monosporascus sp. GIB2]|nr:hypothetical protein DL765_009948 [Monosporascus sp. GIB2]
MNASGYMETAHRSGERPRINISVDTKRRAEMIAKREHEASDPSSTSPGLQQPLPSLTPSCVSARRPVFGRWTISGRSQLWGCNASWALGRSWVSGSSPVSDLSSVSVSAAASSSSYSSSSLHLDLMTSRSETGGGGGRAADLRRLRARPRGRSRACCGTEDADATGYVPWTHTTGTEEKRVQRMEEQKEK